MPGILYYKRYLDTLRSITDYYSTFPSNQTTYTTQVQGTSTYVVTASWTTLIVDPVAWYSDGTPNFFNSQVVGYYAGGTTSQYATGVLSLPEYLYTGPILPTQERNVPVTIVQVQYTTGGETYHHRFGLIQNWEPGVTILDPTEYQNFNPINVQTSTLTLSITPNPAIYSDDLVMIAQSDITDPINSQNYASFYLSSSTDILLGTGFFNSSTNQAQITFETFGSILTSGTYSIYASFPGILNWSAATSNVVPVTIYNSVPLVVSTQTLTTAPFLVGSSATYSLQVIQDPVYPPNTATINSTVTISITDQNLPVNLVNKIITTSSFINGFTSTNIEFTPDMVDIHRLDPATSWTITSSQLGATIYTATISVSNSHRISADWQENRTAQYRKGSTSSLVFTVSSSTTTVVQGQYFNISISNDLNPSYLQEPVSITIDAVDRTFLGTIDLKISQLGSTSTIAQFWSSTTNNLYTATYTFNSGTSAEIFATYAGDLGQTLTATNIGTQSNTINHAILPGNILNITSSSFQRTATNDIIKIYSTFSGTLSNFVSFYEGAGFLGTASWIRQSISYYTTVSTYISTVSNIYLYTPKLRTSQYAIFDSQDIYTGVPFWRNNGQNYQVVTGISLGQYPETNEANTMFGSDTQQGWFDVPNNKTLFRFWNSSTSFNTWVNQSPWDQPYISSGDFVGLGQLGYNVIAQWVYSYNSLTTNTNLITDLPRPIQIGNYTYTLEEHLGTYYPWFGRDLNYNGLLHFYRFSPAIPSSGNTWNLYRPPNESFRPDPNFFYFVSTRKNIPPLPGEWQGNYNSYASRGRIGYFQWFNTPTDYQNGIWYETFTSGRTWDPRYAVWNPISMPVDPAITTRMNTYNNFGNQVWTSADPNDVDQNLVARRANDWFQTMMSTEGPRLTAPAYTKIEYILVVEYTQVQIVTLTLPVNTVVNPANLTAAWPGTLGLPRIYGSFASTSTQITYP